MVILTACNTGLKEDVVTKSSDDRSLKNWKLKNVEFSGDSLVLENGSSALISKFTVQNFDLSLTLKTTPGAEGSLAFHTAQNGASSGKGYSIMINNSDYRQGNPQKTGSLTWIRNFFVRMVDDNDWFTMNLSVRGNHITVLLGDKIVSEYIEPSTPVRLDENKGMILSKGFIVLQKSNNTGKQL